ncbi:MAG: RNA-guided endonuclease InsQ/TnpB family protein [Nitrososphaera sp.]
MKLVVNLKLQPNAGQQRALRDTLERCNKACNWLSGMTFESETFGQYALHKAHYYAMREKFGLTAQAAVRCIAKVADAYKLKNRRETKREFRKWAAQPFDDRILRFGKGDTINLWTLAGRQKIPFICGEHQRALLEHRKGEADLMFVRGKWYIACVCDFDDPKLLTPSGVLGVDFGIVHIATGSDGSQFSGAGVEASRARHVARRATLQRVGTRAARRRLKINSGKQSRYQKHVNHCISKQIVLAAKRSNLAVGLEDLKHIRERVKATKEQRKRLHNWSFGQLRSFVEYKAKKYGVPVVIVNPAYTSQECPKCGHVDKRNRPKQELFRCVACGHSANADAAAACNIAGRGVVTHPMFAHRSVLGAVESLALGRGTVTSSS